jgi:DNA repair exonuclease SbcCD ATPase subunit
MTEEEIQAKEEELAKKEEELKRKEDALSKNSDGFSQEDVDQKVAEAVKDIKSKLDAAYSKRDEALEQLKKIEDEKRKEEIKNLEEAGKEKEAYEMKMQDIQKEMEALKSQNTKLARDSKIKSALTDFDFRSSNAAVLAEEAIIKNVVQNESGDWVAKDGSPISEYVKKYLEHPDNEFLLKPKKNSGGGAPPNKNSNSNSNPGSVKKMGTSTILNEIASGNLKRNRKG